MRTLYSRYVLLLHVPDATELACLYCGLFPRRRESYKYAVRTMHCSETAIVVFQSTYIHAAPRFHKTRRWEHLLSCTFKPIVSMMLARWVPRLHSTAQHNRSTTTYHAQ